MAYQGLIKNNANDIADQIGAFLDKPGRYIIISVQQPSTCLIYRGVKDLDLLLVHYMKIEFFVCVNQMILIAGAARFGNFTGKSCTYAG